MKPKIPRVCHCFAHLV